MKYSIKRSIFFFVCSIRTGNIEIFTDLIKENFLLPGKLASNKGLKTIFKYSQGKFYYFKINLKKEEIHPFGLLTNYQRYFLKKYGDQGIELNKCEDVENFLRDTEQNRVVFSKRRINNARDVIRRLQKQEINCMRKFILKKNEFCDIKKGLKKKGMIVTTIYNERKELSIPDDISNVGGTLIYTPKPILNTYFDEWWKNHGPEQLKNYSIKIHPFSMELKYSDDTTEKYLRDKVEVFNNTCFLKKEMIPSTAENKEPSYSVISEGKYRKFKRLIKKCRSRSGINCLDYCKKNGIKSIIEETKGIHCEYFTEAEINDSIISSSNLIISVKNRFSNQSLKQIKSKEEKEKLLNVLMDKKKAKKEIEGFLKEIKFYSTNMNALEAFYKKKNSNQHLMDNRCLWIIGVLAAAVACVIIWNFWHKPLPNNEKNFVVD